MKWVGFMFPVFVFFLGLFLINKANELDNNNKRLQEVGVEINGKVGFGGSNKDANSRIDYIVDGKEYSIHAQLGRKNGGETISLYYIPDDPSIAVIDLDYYDTRRLVTLILGGFLAACMGLVGMYRSLFVKTSKEK